MNLKLEPVAAFKATYSERIKTKLRKKEIKAKANGQSRCRMQQCMKAPNDNVSNK